MGSRIVRCPSRDPYPIGNSGMSPGCPLTTADRCVYTGADEPGHLDLSNCPARVQHKTHHPVFVERAQAQHLARRHREKHLSTPQNKKSIVTNTPFTTSNQLLGPRREKMALTASAMRVDAHRAAGVRNGVVQIKVRTTMQRVVTTPAHGTSTRADAEHPLDG